MRMFMYLLLIVLLCINILYIDTLVINRKNNEIITKIRCFIKKKYVCLFIFSEITEVVDEKEKKSPKERSNINKKNICLSTFRHQIAIELVFSLLKLII